MGITMAFLTMSMAEIFHSFNMRSQHGSIFSMKSHNLYLYGAMVLSLLLTTAVISIPWLSSLFEFEHISLAEYGVAMLLAFSVIPVVELISGSSAPSTAGKKQLNNRPTLCKNQRGFALVFLCSFIGIHRAHNRSRRLSKGMR